MFVFAWLALRKPFHMVTTPVGYIGDLKNDSVFCGHTYLQSHPSQPGEMAFAHRNLAKWSNYLDGLDPRSSAIKRGMLTLHEPGTTAHRFASKLCPPNRHPLHPHRRFHDTVGGVDHSDAAKAALAKLRDVEHTLINWRSQIVGKLVGRPWSTTSSTLPYAGLDCAQLVKPIDVSPVRSPQAVHSALTRHFRGAELVEIGTVKGDGMNCFARVAKSAIALEADRKQCGSLWVRARALNAERLGNYSVLCALFPWVAPDADVFHWWQEEPHLTNLEALMALRRLQEQGRIRGGAQAVLLFENGLAVDEESWPQLQRWVAWSEEVDFDETALCMGNQLHKLITQIAYKGVLSCRRAKGTFKIVGIPLSGIHLDA